MTSKRNGYPFHWLEKDAITQELAEAILDLFFFCFLTWGVGGWRRGMGDQETKETRLMVATVLRVSLPFFSIQVVHCVESLLKESRSDLFLADTVQ